MLVVSRSTPVVRSAPPVALPSAPVVRMRPILPLLVVVATRAVAWALIIPVPRGLVAVVLSLPVAIIVQPPWRSREVVASAIFVQRPVEPILSAALSVRVVSTAGVAVLVVVLAVPAAVDLFLLLVLPLVSASFPVTALAVVVIITLPGAALVATLLPVLVVVEAAMIPDAHVVDVDVELGVVVGDRKGVG